LDSCRSFLNTIPETEWPRALGAPLWALAEQIGVDAALALAANAGGSRMDVPSLARLERKKLARDIRAARRAGATQRALARRFGCSERTVRTILKEAP
jgi:Mor family transcriptional regulator